MARTLVNAFSAGMLDMPAGTERNLSFARVSEDLARAWCAAAPFVSAVGHADTAELLTATLGVSVAVNRCSTSFAPGDEYLVAQYNGPRLPEGAVSLPEGATLRWFVVRDAGPLARDLSRDEARDLYQGTSW